MFQLSFGAYDANKGSTVAQPKVLRTLINLVAHVRVLAFIWASTYLYFCSVRSYPTKTPFVQY